MVVPRVKYVRAENTDKEGLSLANLNGLASRSIFDFVYLNILGMVCSLPLNRLKEVNKIKLW